jgi:hypothetical protein
MEVQQDFRDLLELFNKHEVDYIIVRAYALGRKKYLADLEAVGED